MCWNESKSSPGTRSAARRCGGHGKSPRRGRTPLAEGRRGEFGRALEQLERADRLAAGTGAIAAGQAIAAAKLDLENRQKVTAPQVETLYTALSEGKWPQILSAAEAVLTSVPEHPAARQARSRAWQQIAAIGPAAARWPQRMARGVQPSPACEPASEEETEPARAAAAPPEAAEGIVWLNGGSSSRQEGSPAGGALIRSRGPTRATRLVFSVGNAAPRPLARVDATGPKGRFLLWVDAVGGYLVCLDHRIVLGRAGPDSHADIPLMGDLSRNHATLLRNGEGYLLEAHHPSFINGKSVTGQALLHDGDVIRLGSTVELEFRQPSPVSATARLSVVSRHRLPLAVDGVILMAETCIVGSESQAHIPAPAIKTPVVLYRQAGALWCRAMGAFDIDGRTCASRAPLTLQSSVLGDGFSFSLEPLGNQSV